LGLQHKFMFAVEKFVPLLALLALSCGKHDYDNSNYLSSVTFFNSSSYYVSIHSSFFSGPVLIDKLASGMSYSTTLSPSNNYGSGSVFSMEYWYLVAHNNECSCGDVWTSGIDKNMQISQNIEAGKDYVIEIPNPDSLELKEAFFKILNTSGKDFELEKYFSSYTVRQAGNGEFSVPSGKVGVYQVNGKTEIKSYTINQIFEFPEFTAEPGYIYNFEFDGKEVKTKEPQNMIFRKKL